MSRVETSNVLNTDHSHTHTADLLVNKARQLAAFVTPPLTTLTSLEVGVAALAITQS